MGEDAPAEARDAITNAVRTLHDYAVSIGLRRIEGPFEIYAYDDVDAVSDAYDRVAGEERRREREDWMRDFAERVELPARNLRDIWEGSGLVVEGSRLFWRVSYDDWRMPYASIAKLRYSDLATNTLARNLYRMYIYEIISPRETVFPVWLHKGARELLEGRAVYFTEFMPYGGMCSIRSILRYLPPSERLEAAEWLKDAEDCVDYSSEDGGWKNAWIYGYAAAEFLASRAGEGSLMRYYYASDPQTDWRDTFSAVFGMTVEDFYDLFGEYSAEGFPGLDFSCVRRVSDISLLPSG